MPKLSLVLVVVIAVGAAAFISSPSARAQPSTSIQYARVTPYVAHFRTSPNSVLERHGYRACVANAENWACRDFAPADSSNDALRTVFATLGNEGWELVSAIKEQPEQISPMGVTYLFKRQAR